MGLLDGLKSEKLNGLKSAEKELTDEELAELREEVSDAIDDEKIVTDADAKREIAIALAESEKVTISEDSPLKKKKNKDGTEAKTKKKPAKKAKAKTKAKDGEKKKLPKKEDKPKKTAKKIVIKGKKTETETIKSDFLPNEVPLILPLEKTAPTKQYEMVHYKAPTPQLAKNFPSLAEVTFLISRFKYVMDELIDESDIVEIRGKDHICKSGWRKCIRAFNISIELVSEEVFDKYDDTHAKVIVRAILPTGQSVEGIGLKSYKDMYTEKNLHNLTSTAWTRAVNRAVSDLVGTGQVSFEELPSKVQKGLFKD